MPFKKKLAILVGNRARRIKLWTSRTEQGTLLPQQKVMFPLSRKRNSQIQILPWAILIMLIGTSVVASSNWHKEKVSRDGISVYSRTTSGTTVREVRAKIAVNAPAEVILDAVCDPNTFKGTTKKYVESNQYYHEKNPDIWFNYQVVNFPVISKRDYTLRYEKISDPQKGLFRLNWRISKRFGPAPKKDVVRVSTIKGNIQITPNKNGKGAIVRYTLLADPGGNIPDWLINIANRRSLPNILREVRDASLKRTKK